jgi:hypothetical protein
MMLAQQLYGGLISATGVGHLICSRTDSSRGRGGYSKARTLIEETLARVSLDKPRFLKRGRTWDARLFMHISSSPDKVAAFSAISSGCITDLGLLLARDELGLDLAHIGDH